MQLKDRIWQWQATQPEPAFVSGWRTPARTKALVLIYATAMPLALILELAAIMWLPLLIPAMILLFASMVAWTVLSNTIGMRDAAPRSALDGYETEVLDLWRHRALQLMSAMILVGAVATIILGVAFSDAVDTAVLASVVGVYMIFCYLAFTTLPAIGYALAFNRNPEE